jgi:hypothetical protein
MSLKKVSLWTSYIFIIVMTCEVLSYLFLAVFLGTISVRDRTGQLLRIAQRDPMTRLAPKYDPVVSAKKERNVLHPYLGFVREPRKTKLVGTPDDVMESYGFSKGGGPLVRTSSDDEVVIGLFGGSVAEYFALDTESLQILGDAITSIPRYKGKKPVFTVAALAGYKQPQQLMAYSYLLTLGARFDLIITLDGFNEVALPPTENVPKNVYPPYPRAWYELALESDPAAKGNSYGLAATRSLLANVAQSTVLRWSMVSRLAWLATDAYIERRIVMNEVKGFSIAPYASFGVSGPRLADTSPQMMYQMDVDTWQRSSIQMSKLATANGAHAFHFLQPNQYAPGSKPFEPEEAVIAFMPRVPYADHVPRGYELLRKSGYQMRKSGTHFEDLSYAFIDHPEPLYTDSCCHFSGLGSRILARRIGDSIQTYFRR